MISSDPHAEVMMNKVAICCGKIVVVMLGAVEAIKLAHDILHAADQIVKPEAPKGGTGG